MALTNAERQRRYRNRRLLRQDDFGPNAPNVVAEQLDRFVRGGHLRDVRWLLRDWAHPDLLNALDDLIQKQRFEKQTRDARAGAIRRAMPFLMIGVSLGGWYLLRGQPLPDWLRPQDGPFPEELEPDWASKLLQRQTDPANESA